MSERRQGAQSLRVLVVEDDLFAAGVVVKHLQRYGFDVRRAVDGAAGVRLAQEALPDVAVLKINGTGTTDGCEAARRIRALPGGDRVLLCAVNGGVAGGSADGSRDRAFDANFDLFFSRSVDPELLVRILLQYERRCSRFRAPTPAR